MKVFCFLICLWVVVSCPLAGHAETELMVAVENGYVITYVPSPAADYMLSTARIFTKKWGSRINCYWSGAEIHVVAVPAVGYEFDYWSGTIALDGYSDVFVMPETGAELTAHFKEIEPCPPCEICPPCDACCPDPPACDPCPDCPECPACETCDPCPAPPACPECDPCPDCICPDPDPCPPCNTDEGLCFIGAVQ